MTRRMASISAVAMLPLLGAAGLAGCSSAQATAPQPAGYVIAWDGAVPSQLAAAQGPPAAPCAASHLRVAGPGLQFAAAASGGIGQVAIRNTGPAPCRLAGWPTVRLAGAPAAPAQRQVDLPAAAPEFPQVLEPAATLQALPPGASAALTIQWSNWCVPGAAGAAKPQVPPSAVRITLGDGLGSLDARYNAVPGCQAPGQPSTVAVRPFAPPPLPSAQPWTTANVKAAIEPPSGAGGPLTGKRGQTARFLIRLRNASAVPVRFDHCPLLAEELAPSGQAEVHRLNCQPAGSIPPGRSVLFEMRIRVPASAPPGRNGLFWELDPNGSQYPEAVSGLVVSR